MNTAANKKLVQQVYADAASRSGTTFVDNLADDAVWIVTGQYSWSHEFRGREAILNGLMGHFRSLFAERPRTVAFNFIAEGDFVVVEARGDNVTKAGLRYDNQYCMVWRIDNGRIKEIKEYCDSALVERVLGPFRKRAGWRRAKAVEQRCGDRRRAARRRVRWRHLPGSVPVYPEAGPAVAGAQPRPPPTRCHERARIAGYRNLVVRDRQRGRKAVLARMKGRSV